MEHFRSYFLQAYTCFNQYKKHWIEVSKQKFNNENKIYSIIDNQMYTFTGLDRKEFNNLVELIDCQLQALPAHKITLFDLIGLGLFHMRFYIPECLTELIFGIPSSTYINYFNSFLDVIISVNPYFQLPRNLGDHVKIIDGKKIAIVIDCVEQYIVKSSDGNLEIELDDDTVDILLDSSKSIGNKQKKQAVPQRPEVKGTPPLKKAKTNRTKTTNTAPKRKSTRIRKNLTFHDYVYKQ